jgi:hypothetical protein
MAWRPVPHGSLIGDEEAVANEVLAITRDAHTSGARPARDMLTVELGAIRGIPAGTLSLGASRHPHAIVGPSAQSGPTAGPSGSRHGKKLDWAQQPCAVVNLGHDRRASALS